MILDYLTSNGLNKYPFDDRATLQTNAGTALANNLFLDLLVASKSPTPVGAFLHKFSNNRDEFYYTLGFTLFDSAGITVHTFEFDIQYDNVIEKEFYGIANEFVAVKVVFGASFITLKDAIVDLTFLKQATTLAGSAFVPMVPRVTSLAFYNWNNGLDGPNPAPAAYFEGNEQSPLANLTLQEGTNTSFSQVTENQMIWDVIPGAGTGIYNDCDSNTGIKTINGLEPEVFNKFRHGSRRMLFSVRRFS